MIFLIEKVAKLVKTQVCQQRLYHLIFQKSLYSLFQELKNFGLLKRVANKKIIVAPWKEQKNKPYFVVHNIKT